MLVGAFVFAGKILGAMREIVLAAEYGTQEPVDTYLLVFNIMTLPMTIWLGLVLAIGVPLFVRADKEDPKLSAQFMSELSAVCAIGGSAVAFILALLLPQAFGLAVLGRSPESIELAEQMVPALSLLVPLGLVAGVLSARLVASERHVNTLLEGTPALVILCAVLAVGGGVAPLVWGSVAGFALQILLLFLFTPAKYRGVKPRFAGTSPLWGKIKESLAIFALGQIAAGAVGVVDQVMVANVGAGAVATLGYASRILALALGLGATAISRVMLPGFANPDSSGDDLRTSARYWAVAMFWIGAFGGLVGWFAAPWVVGLLFERGAFEAKDTLAVSEVLKLGLLQAPFYFAGIVAVQLLAARGAYGQIAITGIGVLVVKVLANLVLVPSWGVGGVMLASALAYALSALLLWWFVAAVTAAKLEAP
jgi:peptidoglycan biosynthesis protein MviN/MurJ (putative lipid II flippase)